MVQQLWNIGSFLQIETYSLYTMQQLYSFIFTQMDEKFMITQKSAHGCLSQLC